MTTETETKGQRWQARVLDQFHIAETDAVFISVELAANAIDRADKAQAVLDEEGLTIQGLHGSRVHPCVSVLRDAVAEHTRIVRLLGLFDEESA